MKKILLGLVFGFMFSAFFFLVRDLLRQSVNIPKGHVTVKFYFETSAKVEYLTLISANSFQKIMPEAQSESLIVFPNIGEGEFKVCFKVKDQSEICDKGHYVESGYSLELKITDKEIVTVKHF